MKVIVLAVVAVVAAAFMWFAFEGECRDGVVVKDQAECRIAGFAPAYCASSFAEAHRTATLDYAPFPTQDACLLKFPFCEPHARVVGGYVPVPRGVCVSRASGIGKPVYERIGQRIN